MGVHRWIEEREGSIDIMGIDGRRGIGGRTKVNPGTSGGIEHYEGRNMHHRSCTEGHEKMEKG